jgi:tetratricopeptide (TPR) repeat protein
LRLLFFALLVVTPIAAQNRFERFGRDLTRVREELRIPKLSAAIVESGKIVWRSGTAVPPVSGAPLQQSITAVQVMQLVERGLMSLDDPVAKYDAAANLPAGATVRQVLSHTADGTPGEEYLYNREFFSSLTAALEKLTGKPLRALSKLEDLAKYAIALDGTELVSAKNKAAMFTPAKSKRGVLLACGLGWFSQSYSGERIVWDFGQDEQSSTLFVKLPGRKLTLIVVSDSKALVEAAHLEDGNVARSPVALAFLEDVVFSRAFQRDEMENRALQAFYLGKQDESAALLRETLDKFPELESSDDLTLLRLLSQLHFPATEANATVVIREHPYLPPAWFYYGMFVENEKRYREAAACFEQITEHRPPWHHWSVGEAKKELSTLQ